jgi:hypothetical protein
MQLIFLLGYSDACSWWVPKYVLLSERSCARPAQYVRYFPPVVHTSTWNSTQSILLKQSGLYSNNAVVLNSRGRWFKSRRRHRISRINSGTVLLPLPSRSSPHFSTTSHHIPFVSGSCSQWNCAYVMFLPDRHGNWKQFTRLAWLHGV